MSELTESLDAKRGLSRTEHVLKSVLNGNVETVRPRLIQALERMGYHVISDAPLYARRGARGLARYYISANILEYPTKLTIGLREIGPDSTLATLDYVSEHRGGMSFKGDLQTLKREAEAIIAITASEQNEAACSSCGTEQVSEARFCRVCGAPTIQKEPAEMQVLRITAETRAGHHLIATGAVMTALGLVIALGLIFIGGYTGGFAIGLVLSVAAAGLLVLFWGIANLSQALNSLEPRRPEQTSSASDQIIGTEPNALPSAPPLITEATTSLLSKPPHSRKKNPVFVKGRDTSPMDQ